jgi:hypothetical protein
VIAAAALGVSVCAAAVCSPTASIAAAGGTGCALDEAQKLANAALSFDDFDQKGATPSTGRKLAESGCFDAAAEATEDFLVRGKYTESQRRVLTFHLGQQLALAGRRREAARLIASSKSPDQAADAELDWNTYVDGVWAYMSGDQAGLQAAIAKLAPLTGNNPINVAALKGLNICFSKDYKTASDAACRSAGEKN